jgi:hypothetical protein
MRNRGVLRSLGSVVVILTVVSLALNEMGYANKMTAKMNGNIVGERHFYAEIECSYGAMLTHEQLVAPFCGGELGACLSDGVERAKLAQHPILLAGIFQKLNCKIHTDTPNV